MNNWFQNQLTGYTFTYLNSRQKSPTVPYWMGLTKNHEKPWIWGDGEVLTWNAWTYGMS